RPHVEGNRNFVTKIWNAARFVLSQSSHPPAPSSSSGEGERVVSPLPVQGEGPKEALLPPSAGVRAVSPLPRTERGAGGEGQSLADRWIVSRLNRLSADATRLIEDYQFGEAGRQIYEFFWSEYCDWYLEIAKIQLRSADERGDCAARTTTLSTLTSVLECALRLLHPYMPFVTEEIYQQMPGHCEAL